MCVYVMHACLCVSVLVHVCACKPASAKLAPGSWAITLYEVWQGESKTSALQKEKEKKNAGLGLILGCGSENMHSYTEIEQKKHIENI